MNPNPNMTREPARLRVVVAECAADLQQHVEAWDKLADDCLDPNPFYESWMLLPALKAFGGTNPPVFVLIYQEMPGDSERLCGFFPLCRERPKGSPFEVLALWTHMHCFLRTPLLLADTAVECLMELARWAATDRRGARVFRWEWISADGHFQRYFGDFLRGFGGRSRVEETFTRALFRSCENAETYFAETVSSSGRRDLRRLRRRLAEMGNLEFRVRAADEPVQPWVDEFLELEASGWKGKNQTALASNPAERDYFLDICRGARERGRMDMHGLFLDGKPVALRCAFLSGQRAFGFKLAFNEEYAGCSPGILLEVESIGYYHMSPRLIWLDSCAAPDSGLANRLYRERRCLQTVLVGMGSLAGDLYVVSGPLLDLVRRFPRRIRRVFSRLRRA